MNGTVLSVAVGVALGLVAFGLGVWSARRTAAGARASARALLHEAAVEAENKKKESLVAAQERLLGMQEEADRREREIDDRETALENRAREVERRGADSERERRRLAQRERDIDAREAEAVEHLAGARAAHETARADLERVAGLTPEQARQEILRSIEDEARAEGDRHARRIEEEARESAERQAVQLMVQAAERVNLHDVVESTVSFIELPSDDMKGRIIGREGRNIRSLEMATGIDLVVDDTPRSILISSFDPLRREIARLAIERLVEDGRIHPARIEEVVEKAREEIDSRVDQRGTEVALSLGISDLHPKLVRLVGRMRYHTSQGRNLLRHAEETARIAGHMAQEIDGPTELVVRAGLLHDIGLVSDVLNGHPSHNAADLCARFGESEEIVETLRELHPDVDGRSLAAQLIATASRMSDARPGARKENLAVFVERLRRLEDLACRFPEVDRAYAVKAGRELRVLVEASRADDERTYRLSKEIARAIERELSYPGQIRVSVIRETRAVRFAM